MAMTKKSTATVPETTAAPLIQNNDSGTDAAVGRLTSAKSEPANKAYKPRDFDAEARGKTRCVQFEAALMSPAIAGLKFKNLEEYLVLVRQAADAGVAYTFGEEKK